MAIGIGWGLMVPAFALEVMAVCIDGKHNFHV
jgi:hypothetical protein